MAEKYEQYEQYEYANYEKIDPNVFAPKVVKTFIASFVVFFFLSILSGYVQRQQAEENAKRND